MNLRFTSCQAPNAEGHVSQIVTYLGKRLGVDAEVVDYIGWQSREDALYKGEIQLGWICGLPYVVEADRPKASIELLVAPVMAGERYQDLPVYYSDVIVRADSEVSSFADLSGKTWAYNEPHSHSGYNITRYMLAKKDLNGDFFSTRVAAGSHERALKLLLRGSISASAIDSTVLETELRNRPDIASEIRVLESWGPSPIPPWVIHRSVDKKMVAALRNEMLSMAANDEGRGILEAGGVSKFVSVTDADYQTIREMYKAAQRVIL
jgi:phosphonate transport system substrate-binding protein